MTKAAITEQFYQNHQLFMDYINTLPDAEFTTAVNGKWTPGQQLEHILLCLKPMAKVLAAKSYIIEKFGVIDRRVWEYDTTISNYKTALANGGKAPENFLPAVVAIEKKAVLIEDTNQILTSIGLSLDHYSEEELDSLMLPHPLLGKLTIREFLFMMSYHATHHLEQTKLNLTV